MVEDEPSSTILLSSTRLDPNPPPPHPDLLSQDFPCLPSKPLPNREPPNPNLSLSKEISDSDPLTSSRNPWLKPPLLGQLITRKFVLRFIPPTARGTDQVGICPGEAVAGELKILDLTLVGFFLGKKPGFSYVRSNLLKQWKIRGSVQMLQLMQGGFAFRFSDIEDRDQILEAGVFYVGGQPIFIRSWERNIHSGGILGLKQIPLWVSLPGLPLHLWGEDSLSAICSVLGKPLYSDRITAEKSRWSFARACVEFSGSSPLLDSITIEDDVGNVFHQPVKYDWKPPHCISCGIFGHIHDSCKREARGAEHEHEDAHEAKTRNLNLQKQDIPTQTDDEEPSKIETGLEKNTNPEHLNLGKGKTFSELLQKRTSKLLRGWNPIRVKKTGSAVHDPTRIRKTLHTQVQKSDLSQTHEDVADSGALDGGPNQWSTELGCQSKALSSPPVLEKNLNFKQPASCIPHSTNRFGILDLDVDTSPCPQPLDMSLSVCDSDQVKEKEACPSFCSPTCEGLNRDFNHSSQTCEPHIFEKIESEKNISLSQRKAEVLSRIVRPANTSSGGLSMNRTSYKHSIYSYSDRSAAQPNQPPSSPSPGPSLPLNGTDSSSAGRTPYHTRFSNRTYFSQSDSSCLIPSKSMNSMDSNSDEPDQMMEPIPYFTSADGTAEDVEEDVDEEENGIEEDVDEDSEEEKEDQPGREDAVEETAKRKKLSNYGKDNDLWVTTTDLNDPRRNNFC